MAADQPTVYFAGAPGEEIAVPFERMSELVDRAFAGEWWTIDPGKVERFEEGTYLHELAFPWAEATFPDGIVEGFHLLSLLDYMLNPILRLRGGDSFGWNYGLDRVRFVSPITVQDRIRVTGRVAEVRPKDGGFLIRQDCAIEVEGREKPGVVAEWWVFWLLHGPLANFRSDT